jgi:O-antigen/teichoic acid export membrane protein
MTAQSRDGIAARVRALTEPALFIAIAGRVWQSLAGLLTLYFVVVYFTPEIQGYHQTFVSLVALQSFFELGVMVAIVSAVSHEWAGLDIGPGRVLVGNEERRRRLAALTRFVLRWYFGAAVLLLVVGGSVGLFILSKQGETDTWLWPWIATIAATSAFMWCQGMVAVIEGCNQVFEVALYRLVHAIAGSVALILAVANGAGIWSLAVMMAVNIACVACFLVFIYGRLFLSLLRLRQGSSFSWKNEIWPMQWPLALQGVAGYFMFSLFVPVIYSYHGVVEAGRTGISVQVVMAILAIATTFVAVKAPRMGTMYAKGDYDRFESTWITVSAVSLCVSFVGSAAVAVLLIWGHMNGLAYVQRFLDPIPFLLLLGWGFLLQWLQCAAAYWRAQRREAVRGWGVVPGLVTGACAWYFGRDGGATGMAGATLGVALLVSIPLSLYFLAQSRRMTEARRREGAESTPHVAVQADGGR